MHQITRITWNYTFFFISRYFFFASRLIYSFLNLYLKLFLSSRCYSSPHVSSSSLLSICIYFYAGTHRISRGLNRFCLFFFTSAHFFLFARCHVSSSSYFTLHYQVQFIINLIIPSLFFLLLLSSSFWPHISSSSVHASIFYTSRAKLEFSVFLLPLLCFILHQVLFIIRHLSYSFFFFFYVFFLYFFILRCF